MQPMANLVFYGGSLCLSWSDIIVTTVVTVEICNFGGFFCVVVIMVVVMDM